MRTNPRVEVASTLHPAYCGEMPEGFVVLGISPTRLLVIHEDRMEWSEVSRLVGIADAYGVVVEEREEHGLVFVTLELEEPYEHLGVSDGETLPVFQRGQGVRELR